MTPKGAVARWLHGAVRYAGDICLLWPFATNGNGYGILQRDARKQFAHRVVCQAVHGAAPDGMTDCLHSCGNPLCVAPRHLRWGTPSENAQDMISHGRDGRGGAPGVSNCNAKLTDADVIAIRASRARPSDLAEEYGVTRGVIWCVRTRRTWRHV